MDDLHFGGSETESEAALDKEYWIRRAGEVNDFCPSKQAYFALL